MAVGVGGLWNVYPHHRERAGGVGRVLRQVNLRLSNCSTLGVAKNWGRGGGGGTLFWGPYNKDPTIFWGRVETPIGERVSPELPFVQVIFQTGFVGFRV